MLGVGRDLWGSSSPTLLPKQGHIQQAAQDLVQAGLEYSPEKDTPQPPWATCSSAPSPSEGRSSSSGSAGTSSASVCARCPLSCRWPSLKRVWPHKSSAIFLCSAPAKATVSSSYFSALLVSCQHFCWSFLCFPPTWISDTIPRN